MTLRQFAMGMNIACFSISLIGVAFGPQGSVPVFAVGVVLNLLAIFMNLPLWAPPKKTRLEEWKEKCRRD
jgi:hypothetical protein